MRLFDKVLSQGSAELKETMSQVTGRDDFAVVSCDEVALHYASHDKQVWGYEDFPYFVPPWSYSFFEWNEPSKMLLSDGWFDMPHPGSQIGAACWADEGKEAVLSLIQRMEQMAGFQIDDSVAADAMRTIVLRPIVYGQSRLIDLNIITVVLTDNDGLVKWYGVTGPNMQAVSRTCGQDVIFEMCNNLLHVIGLTCTLANCKNVTIDDCTEEMQPRPKVMRRLKLPSVKRYTLSIGGHSTIGARTAGTETGAMPYHLCRGHFATYTPEKPLFGKYVGKFWVPPHTRGSKKNGVIEKDYAVATPALEGKQ